jgi:hypothetical protein
LEEVLQKNTTVLRIVFVGLNPGDDDGALEAGSAMV